MRSLRRAVAFVLLLVLCPGVGELVENVGYLVSHGHFAHAAAVDHHDSPSGPEHGCTGLFHMCPCHSTAMTLLSTAVLSGPTLQFDRAVARERLRADSGQADGVFRPPRTA